jgi:hypothetical protein
VDFHRCNLNDCTPEWIALLFEFWFLPVFEWIALLLAGCWLSSFLLDMAVAADRKQRE